MAEDVDSDSESNGDLKDDVGADELKESSEASSEIPDYQSDEKGTEQHIEDELS